MHDRTVSLDLRIDAARMALPLTEAPQPFFRVHPDLVLKIPPLQ
jgi:hypothetical protein